MATQTASLNSPGFSFSDSDGNEVSVFAQADPNGSARVQLVAKANDGSLAPFFQFEMVGGGRLSGGPINVAGNAFVLTDDAGNITWAG